MSNNAIVSTESKRAHFLSVHIQIENVRCLRLDSRAQSQTSLRNFSYEWDNARGSSSAYGEIHGESQKAHGRSWAS